MARKFGGTPPKSAKAASARGIGKPVSKTPVFKANPPHGDTPQQRRGPLRLSSAATQKVAPKTLTRSPKNAQVLKPTRKAK